MIDFFIAVIIWFWLDVAKQPVYDLKTDSSITKYVDNKIHYKKIDYVPKDLVDLKWKYLIDVKWHSKIRKVALEKLNLLSRDFYNYFGEKLRIVSAYRTYKYQKKIKDGWCPDLFCAKAGYSEHQSGLAVDVWEASEVNKYKNKKKLKNYFEWMKNNWPKYGFTNSYQKGRKIDWYAIEPWHWRYVWKKLAKYLKKNNLTFAEYYYRIKK
jgi:D-alanyl-D-alanine carboxypeptidase